MYNEGADSIADLGPLRCGRGTDARGNAGAFGAHILLLVELAHGCHDGVEVESKWLGLNLNRVVRQCQAWFGVVPEYK